MYLTHRGDASPPLSPPCPWVTCSQGFRHYFQKGINYITNYFVSKVMNYITNYFSKNVMPLQLLITFSFLKHEREAKTVGKFQPIKLGLCNQC